MTPPTAEDLAREVVRGVFGKNRLTAFGEANAIRACLAFAEQQWRPDREAVARAIFEASPDRFMRVGQCYAAADAILALPPTPATETSA